MSCSTQPQYTTHCIGTQSWGHSTLINPTVVQVLKKYDDWERRTGYFRQRKKEEAKTKFIDLGHAGNDKLFNWLLLTLGRWLMLARRFCVYNASLKVDVAVILTVILTSNDENVHSCKRPTVFHRAFCFWRLLCAFLALWLTTVSLDRSKLPFWEIERYSATNESLYSWLLWPILR